VILAIALPSVARADELDEQLEFLERRTKRQLLHAEVWWGGWLGVYVTGAVVQGGRAAAATETAEQADLWISAIKSGAGAMRLMADPRTGIRGMSPRPPGRLTRAQKVRRIRHGESVLLNNAEETQAFGLWYVHVINFSVNLLGGIIIAVGFDDTQRGVQSAAIGTLIGEAAILTGPWEADRDLAEYQRRFGRRIAETNEPSLRLRVQPTTGGAMLRYEF
jgi:hypothetical protein